MLCSAAKKKKKNSFFLSNKFLKKEVAQRGAGLPEACFLVRSLIHQCLLSARCQALQVMGILGTLD